MPATRSSSTKILGIEFFGGTVAEAIDRMRGGGLLVVPAAPALKDLEHHAGYREALVSADLAVPDSSFMVLAWNFLQHDSIRRLSGLAYLRGLLADKEFRGGKCLWIMASPVSGRRNVAWLKEQGIDVPLRYVYLAPVYAKETKGTVELTDATLLALVEELRPRDIVVTLGGGTQERLGLYLKRNLSYRPAIHCIGAAMAFLSGDQVHIPAWADRLYLGWLFRSVSNPKLFLPRYWQARKLLDLMRRYRDRLPVGAE